MKAKDIVSEYNKKFKKDVVVEDKPKLNNTDLKAKAIVESLIENNFSTDVPTRVDAVTELLRLAELNSPIAASFFDIFDSFTSRCTVGEDGKLKFHARKY